MEGESTQHEAYGFVVPNRTAGCGPACPVVWEGGGPSPSPYPDYLVVLYRLGIGNRSFGVVDRYLNVSARDRG